MTPNENQPVQMKIFQLKISLDEIERPIWRRLRVPGDVSLFKLHFIFQIAMGWTNSHLHEFHIEDQYYGIPDEDGWDIREIKEEKEYRLEQVISSKGFQFSYLYDFGDSWEHTILIEDILEPVDSEIYPTCLDGASACPPEDVGGIWGYEVFLEAISDPDHPEHDGYLTWAGGSFDPDAFDRSRIDAELRNIDRSEMVRIYQRYYSDEVGPEFKLYSETSDWLEALSPEERIQLDELPLRRDTFNLLTYLGEHRTTGTQSTGNLPLKAIREATASFVHPPELESKIGDRVYKIRSEYEVWPVYFIHSLLEVGGLIEGGPGRRLRLTQKGEQFLASEPPIQVWFLLETWWYHTNWLIAYPFEGMGDRLPEDFTYITLDHLLALPIGRSIPFEDFADQLILSTGLKWETPDKELAWDFLHTAIERMVIEILKVFQAVEREEKDANIGSYRYKQLHAFIVTKLGRGLLQSVASRPF